MLTLSASPIPRTLEMAFAGIRDLSMITTPPADRRPILTHVGEYNEAAVVEAIRRELLREGQVFFVHNRVSDIDQVARRIGQLVPDARIAVAHGQMDEGTLERVMIDFWERRFDVLVCTTIVESGIDLPSVNTLIVDRAERLGLGQLHQLRGRVGRSGQRAYAYLFHPADQVLSETAYERLRTIGDNTALGSGFKIAMRDLEIRGAGNLLGHDQSGPGGRGRLRPLRAARRRGGRRREGRRRVPRSYRSTSTCRARPTCPRSTSRPTTRASRRTGASRASPTHGRARRPARRVARPLRPAAARRRWACSNSRELRLACIEAGVGSVVVMPARVGVRSKPVVKHGAARASRSRQQMRLRRRHGSRAYDETSKDLRLELTPDEATPRRVAGPAARTPRGPGQGRVVIR